MTPRELVIRTLNHEAVSRIPRDIWIDSAWERRNPDAVAEIHLRFPSDILQPDVMPPLGKRSQGDSNEVGEYTDAWGCGWRRTAGSERAELVVAPLAGKKIADYEPPRELLEPGRFEKVDKSCENSHRFMLAWSETRIFDRLRCLRGPDAALMDLARDTKDCRRLLATLHDFSRKEMERWAATEVDGVVIRDDWGAADSTILALEMWREYFKPLYREYCDILHEKDKFVFFRSTGDISDILPDLIQDGVDAIHADFPSADIEKWSKRFRGRVTFWGGSDPALLRTGNTPLIKEEVLKTRRALDFGSGGIIALCDWQADIPLQSIAAVYEQWLVTLSMHA